MKGKLIILVGISNSGKSTWASRLVQKNPKAYIRVNRDDIRNLLYGYNDETISSYYERDDIRTMEKQITRFEDTLIYDSLELGKIVIVDATHLTRKYIERFKYWNVATYIETFPIDLQEAFERNSKRVRKVPNKVMEKQFNQFSTLTKSLEKDPIDLNPVVLGKDFFNQHVYVFDIDGTLAHHRGRRSPFEWDKVGQDDVDISLSLLVRNLSKNVKIIIATGRDGACIDETEKWLKFMDIHYDEIYIRPKGDVRPDWLVKQEMAQKILEKNYILGWFDDRLQVTRHLRMLDINVYNVAHGNF